jgi:hypothetical protein
MNDYTAGSGNLLDTTDCLEAIDIFKGWKNFLFGVVIISMLLLQGSFWLLNSGFVVTEQGDKVLPPVITKVVVPQGSAASDASEQTAPQPVTPPDEIAEAAKQAVTDPNVTQLPVPPAQPAESATPPAPAAPAPADSNAPAAAAVPPAKEAAAQFKLNIVYLNWVIRLCNFALIAAATLYCLTILFCLKISLLGRLGGIKHISKAFFLALTALILLLPWQLAFNGVFAGVIFTPQQLLDANAAAAAGSILAKVFLYIRFTGYWLVVLLIVFSAQVRTGRWARATLRRLEVMQ